MLNALIAYSLKNRTLIIASAIIVAFAGFYTAKQMPIDVLPNLNRPTVVIMTEAHAMTPINVEQLVTLPLEQILNGATGVERVRSASGLGLSVIKVEFAWGSDIYRNRQIVAEKLVLAKDRLPDNIIPIMAPISSVMGQIQIIGLRSKNDHLSQEEIRSIADNRLKYDLLAIPGVSKVIVSGSSTKQLQVKVDALKLRAYGVTIKDVENAILENNQNSSGGFMELGTKSPVITVTGMLNNKDELAKAVVSHNKHRPIRISDVAAIEFGPSAIKVGESGINGHPGVLLVIMKQPEADTLSLTQNVSKSLIRLNDALPEGIEIISDLFRQADFIHRAIDNVFEAVRDGGLMVIIILFIFLMNWRVTLITLTAIPISIAMTALIFSIFGISINTMTLGGLAVAIGALVDDAIVDVENVFRRLRQNALLDSDQKKHPLVVIYEASSEVRQAIVIGTLLVIIVYTPLFFLSGMEGQLFTPIGYAYIISVGSSLIVSLTLTPALSYYLLPNNIQSNHKNDSFVVSMLKKVTSRVIRFSVNMSTPILAALLITTGIAFYILANTGTSFLPPFNEGVVQINLVLPPETGLKTSNEYGRRLEKLLIQIPGVQHVTRRTGRAEGDEHAESVNNSEAIITFDNNSDRSRDEILSEIRTEISAEFPGVAFAVDQPLAHLLSAMLSGIKAQVAIKISGPDLNMLRNLAQETEGLIKNIPGIKDLMVEPQVLIPNISIEPKREMLARHGLSVDDVGQTIELSLGGERISRFVQGRFSYPITLSLQEDQRKSLNDIRNLYLKKPDDTLIRLEDVARVIMNLENNNIKHENMSRRIVVQNNIQGRSLGEVVSDIEKSLLPLKEKLNDLTGYSIHISGQFEAQQAATKKILLLSLLSVACMVMILYLHFKSLNLSFQVLASIPMSFIGAVIYIYLSEQVLSVASLVGLISLGGIASRNAILLIDHYIYLLKVEKMPFSVELIIKAGQERMVPVMMTALTSGIALIPLALSPGEPGKEILYPVATVIIGGLISSTLLDFIVRPALFYVFGKNAINLNHQDEQQNPEESFFTPIQKEI
ncbi:MAG: efflux RND transporter permease subunit [Planctomycetes bacterium]|nr:efflux RND transporter permease subunit [Planctomycetota bacterium]